MPCFRLSLDTIHGCYNIVITLSKSKWPNGLDNGTYVLIADQGRQGYKKLLVISNKCQSLVDQ